MASGLGFFAGGLADSLSAGMSRNQQADFQQKELQIQQQGQQMQQQRFELGRVDTAVAALGQHIANTIDAGKIAGEDPKTIMSVVGPLFDQYEKLTTSAGRGADFAKANLAAWIAAPPSTQTESAHAAAKVNPQQAAKPEVIGQDQVTGEPQYGTYNKSTQKYEPMSVGGQVAAGTGQSSTVQPSIPVATPTTNPTSQDPGEDFLSKIPENRRQQVKDLADYNLDPNTFSTRIPKGMTRSEREVMVGLAEQYAASKGETYRSTQYPAVKKAMSLWIGGGSPESRAVRSFNVLVSHLDVLNDAAKALKNKDIPSFNRIKNVIASETGAPAPATFEAVKAIVADEMNKAIIGGAGAFGDREKLQAQITAASSPAQLASIIDNFQKLAAGQLKGLEKQYQVGTGLDDFSKRFLFPRTQTVFGEFDQPSESGKDSSRSPSGTSSGVRWSIEP